MKPISEATVSVPPERKTIATPPISARAALQL
jgi:hypothetical protein